VSDAIRSADLLVKTALSSPQTLEDLKEHPEQTLTALGAQVIRQLPLPTPPTTDSIWKVIVYSLAFVLILSSIVLGIGTFVLKPTTPAVNGDTILTLFTTVVGYLAGLLSPSPIGKSAS
jgi:hypothetical protein